MPIVFTHRSNSDYLKYSLAQAKSINPQSTVFLLGDAANNVYDFVEHHFMDDYFGGAVEFGKVYKHYSTHPWDFELICFQRWFALRDFLRAHNIQKCLYLDSDVMLYSDATKEAKKFEHFDFTLSHLISGHTFFLNRIEALDDFCNFCTDVYTRKDSYHYDKMLAHFTARKRNGLKGGVCDMTALQLYSELHFGQVGEVAQILDGSVYDPSIASPLPGFEMENGIKKIVWKNELPYGKHIRTGREIRFNSLHLQGTPSKRLMKEFYTGNITLG